MSDIRAASEVRGATRTEDSGIARPFDARLKREIAHRRLAVSLGRRFLRILGLHVVDGALTVAAIAALAGLDPVFAGLRLYTPATVAIVLISLNALSAYEPGDGRRDYRRVLSGVGLSLLILLCLIVFPPHLSLSFANLVAFGASEFLALAAGRKAVDYLMRQVYVRGIGLRRAVLIGDLDDVGRALLQLRDERRIDQYIEGHLALETRSDPTALGDVGDLPRVLLERGVEEVIIATSLPGIVLRQVAECCFDHGVTLYVIPSVAGAVEYRAESLRVGTCPMLRLHPARLEFPGLLLKRAFDLVIATLMLVLTLPLMALIALAIKLDSPGPVFFRAQRVGLGGRLFPMWKFRSMVNDAQAREHEMEHLNIYRGGTFKVRNDPRVTRVGRVLRRTSLDELPQLLNILTGEMSLVGPRPALVADLERYEPHHFERLSVIPGLTGPWQVGGRNLITDFETIFRIDCAYIRSWSLLLDVKIMLLTVKVVVTGEGAY